MAWSLFNKKPQKDKPAQKQQLQMLTTDAQNNFSSWDGQIYNNDLIRSIIRSKARAVAKTTATHIRNDSTGLKTNPEPYMRILLEEPNPIMTMQQMLEKVITQLELNNNAFIYVAKDVNGFPIGLYPVISTSIQIYQTPTNKYLLQFTLKSGRTVTFHYEDLIHLKQDYNDNELFGTANTEVLRGLLGLHTTLDQAVVKAIKNSNVVQWLLKFKNNLSPDDIKVSTKMFVDSFLDIESADFAGAAASDTKYDVDRIESKSIMPQSDMQKEVNKRIYAFYNTNEKIITSDYNENEWIAFFESCVEPILKQLSDTFTKALFTRKERSYGNKIVFQGADMAFASLRTKLALVAMVDRGALSPNEWRATMNYAPIENGDVYLLRKDTGTAVEGTKGGEYVPEYDSEAYEDLDKDPTNTKKRKR